MGVSVTTLPSHRGLGRGRGSAPAGRGPKVHLTVRIDHDVDAAMRAAAREHGSSCSRVVETALRLLLRLPPDTP